MTVRDRITQKAARFLEPGEQIQVVFPAQTTSRVVGNRYRCVVVTDRRVLVLDSGRWSQSTPRSLLASLPRATRLGPATGHYWHTMTVGGETLIVTRRFHKDIDEADRLA